MLEARDLQYRYGLTAGEKNFELQGVSMKLEEGYLSCLLGRNGAGKTTLLSLLYGMLKPWAGEVLWNGEPLTGKNLVRFRREVAYAGETWCAENMTLGKNVEMLSLLYPSFDRAYFESLVKLAGVEDCMEKRFATLSTGERVKSEIAFLMARRPKFILLDEPLANIDPVFKVDVLELLQKAVAENETGVLISTHLVDEISDVVDYVYVLEKGKLAKAGSKLEMLGDGQLRDIFR